MKKAILVGIVAMALCATAALGGMAYSWENDIQGWKDNGGNGNPLPATFSTEIGVTDGSYSLELDVPQTEVGGANWTPFGGPYDFNPFAVQDVIDNNWVRLDVTVPEDTVYVPDWASIQVALHLLSNTGNTADVAYTVCPPGETTTVEFDYSAFDFTGASWVQFRFITNIPNLLSDPGSIYVDNFRVETDGEQLPGDANGDGAVTDADYTIWADNYDISPATFEMGDFNGDGGVSDADYTIWADNYGAGLEAVPEPATLSLIALSGLALLRRRK
jgi:PEP-CTERM motif-containing protein